MKTLFEKIKNAFMKGNTTAAATAHAYTPSPHRHWVLLLRVFFIAIILLIGFSLYLLYEIRNEQVFHAPVKKDSSQPVLKEATLKSVTSAYAAKAQKEADLRANPPIFADPSK